MNDVFLIPVGQRCLVHAPLRGVTSVINRAAAAELRAYLATGNREAMSPPTQRVADALEARDTNLPTAPRGTFAPHQVALLPTNDCNMRCLYCAPGAGSHDVTTMPEAVCDAALRYQAKIVDREGFKSLMVYLFGGEPFFAWDLVRFCDDRARALADEIGRPAWFACTTNAFMSAERARWVGQHMTFVLVSLDGPAELHNFYRPSKGGGATHAVVVRNLKLFEEEGLAYGLRCSVDSRVVERLPEVVDYFCREFHPAKINFEPLVLHGRCLETGLRSPEPHAFVNAVIAAGRVARGYGVDLKLTTAQTDRIAESNCAVADDNFVVAPDGLVSSCFGANHRASEYASAYAIGEVDPASLTVRIDQEKVDRVRTYGVSTIPRCRDCFCKWHCSGGCRLFHTAPFSDEPPGAMCLVTQKLTLWRLLEQLRLFEDADQVRLDPEEVRDACA